MDTIFLKTQNRDQKNANRSPHWAQNSVSFSAGKLQGSWRCLMCSGYPVHANTPGVFDRTGGHFHIIGAHIGEIQKTKPLKCPD